MGGGVVRRRVQYSDWEPVRPDHWAEEPLTLNDAIAHWNEYDEQRDQEKNGEESPGQELAALRAEVAAARTFAAEMRDFCSPHGVATDYADRLIEAMDRARAAGLPSGAREVRVVVRAPSDENAGQWAQTIRDLVLAEYGDSMRLEVTITPGGQA
ncbi:hypothetical protein [Streptomyces africanus]|uniref:hypothetical protein n=1 Tax=Streptomyces africanus TaxID=231024 RepID=UPI000A3AC524|nr:hypothetical protein [Streptomyces africanus]